MRPSPENPETPADLATTTVTTSRVTSEASDVKDRTSEAIENALSARNRQLDSHVKAELAERRKEAMNRRLPEFLSYVLPSLESALKEMVGAEEGDGYFELTVPPSAIQDKQPIDLAWNAASAARNRKQNPVEFAQEIAAKFATHPLVAEATTIGPFVNLRLDVNRMAPEVFQQIAEQKGNYGAFNEGNNEVVLVDYSSPNVAKNMTVAHLRSTIIGESLANLHAAAGYIPFRVNHLGDWGTQFGKIIYEYRKALSEEGPVFIGRLHQDPTVVLLELYRKFVAREKEDPNAVEEARAIFLRLEQGDPELTKLWEQFLSWSMRDFSRVYERLDIRFDAVQGESFYEDRMQAVVEEGVSKGVLQRNDDGSVVFPGQPLVDSTTGKVNDRLMLDKDGDWRDEVILKPSGGTVYLTRDLAAISYRARELGVGKILYVIGKEQQKHCQMLFAMAEQLGVIERGQAEHVSFGHLNVDGRKMKSRGGKIALLEEVLDDSIQAAKGVIENRRDDTEKKTVTMTDSETNEVARKVGMSALIFNDLRQDRQRDIEFSPDVAQHVESGQSPYLQYTYCRLGAILEKAGASTIVESVEVPENCSPLERSLLVQLAMFPVAIKEAVKANAPHRVATYMTDLCLAMNHFYATHPVANAENGTRSFRLALVRSVKQVLENASRLLHIELPSRM